MKLTLNESVKKFIDTLDEADHAKLTFNGNIVESSDESIHDKLLAYHKTRLTAMGARIKAETEQFKMEHPEYFN